jgi:hypothetical protein
VNAWERTAVADAASAAVPTRPVPLSSLRDAPGGKALPHSITAARKMQTMVARAGLSD